MRNSANALCGIMSFLHVAESHTPWQSLVSRFARNHTPWQSLVSLYSRNHTRFHSLVAPGSRNHERSAFMRRVEW